MVAAELRITLCYAQTRYDNMLVLHVQDDVYTLDFQTLSGKLVHMYSAAPGRASITRATRPGRIALVTKMARTTSTTTSRNRIRIGSKALHLRYHNSTKNITSLYA